MSLSIFHQSEALLGEGPVWSQTHSSLFWLDILNKRLFSKTMQGEFSEYLLPETFSSFYVKGDDIFGCTETGFCKYSLNTHHFERLVEIERELKGNRSNDGQCDNNNGFIFGTMGWDGDKKSGKIYHVDINTFKVKVLDSGFFIPNGFAFINEFTQLIIADSLLGVIYTYDYDSNLKELKNKRKLVDLSDSGLSPDGMVSLEDNTTWNAIWDGSKLNKYDSKGNILDFIEVPVLRPTSCSVGGLDDNTLFITSASEGLSRDQLNQYPLSGSVFSYNLEQ